MDNRPYSRRLADLKQVRANLQEKFAENKFVEYAQPIWLSVQSDDDRPVIIGDDWKESESPSLEFEPHTQEKPIGKIEIFVWVCCLTAVVALCVCYTY